VTRTNYEAPHYTVFSILLLLPQHFILKHSQSMFFPLCCVVMNSIQVFCKGKVVPMLKHNAERHIGEVEINLLAF